jgi:hypothetical protein
MSLILPSDYPTVEDYQGALEDAAEHCKHNALTLQESLDYDCYRVPDFETIERWIKMTQSSLRKVRKTIEMEKLSREANRYRQEQKRKQQKQD